MTEKVSFCKAGKRESSGDDLLTRHLQSFQLEYVLVDVVHDTCQTLYALCGACIMTNRGILNKTYQKLLLCTTRHAHRCAFVLKTQM